MSEVDSRPAPSRGRSSTRGGRGGIGRGGPRGGHRQANGTLKEPTDPLPEDQGELGEMKKQYSEQLVVLKELFPDWTDVDLLFALQERDGDLPATIDGITEGHISQFAEIKKPKDRARSKVKDTAAATGTESLPIRGARARSGLDATRGGRTRGGDRGRGGSRGGRGGSASNGAPRDTAAASVPTTESPAWDAVPAGDVETTDSGNKGGWGDIIASESNPATASEGTKPSLIPDGGAKKTWASMFAQPKPKPVAAAQQQQPVVPGPIPAELQKSSEPTEAAQPTTEELTATESLPEVPSVEVPAIEEPIAEENPVETVPANEGAEAALSQPQDPLTEDNLEHLPDMSHPPATHTAASTVGSMDARGTPMGLGPQAPIGRPPLGGYASSAYRATGLSSRSASFQRRVLDQQEAVVMPGHNAVDRAAVQFGSMGLNGESEGPDVDEEREEAETRTQPPQQSPAQPRASLPPAPIQPPVAQDQFKTEPIAMPKPAPGLPPAPQQHQQSFGAHAEPSPISSVPQGPSQDSLGSAQQYSQYGRYGQSEPAAPAQKPYDPFSHQTPTSAYDHYSQQQPSNQQQHQGFGAYSSAPSDYSQYYTADQQRNAYQQYYGAHYGQQNQSQQDNGPSQQRTTSGLGSGPSDSGFPSAQSQQQSQARYNEPQGPAQNTPGTQQQSTGPSQPVPQQHQAQQYNSAYPYGHPYYQSPYHAAYQNQFGFSPAQPGYGGAPFGNKGGMYGQPHGYGPSSYEQTGSGGTGGYNQQSSMPSRESGLGGGLGDYGRSSSSQPSQHGLGSGGFGGMSEPFGRSQSGYQGQPQSYGQQQSAPADDLKAFGESKNTGPSPALGQPGRPDSAANSAGGQSQSSLPPPQSHQQGFGGYPGFNQSSQYGSGLGGLGGHGGQQSHQQQGGYGGYGGGFGNSYNQYARGGWGAQNYGH